MFNWAKMLLKSWLQSYLSYWSYIVEQLEPSCLKPTFHRSIYPKLPMQLKMWSKRRLKSLTWPLFNRTLQAYNIEFRAHVSPAHILCVLHAPDWRRTELSRLGYLELAATLDARTLQHSSKSAWGRLCHIYLGPPGTRINQSDTILFTIRKSVRIWPGEGILSMPWPYNGCISLPLALISYARPLQKKVSVTFFCETF